MTDADYKKLQWASRRGMLELDVVLLPYLEQYGRDMQGDEVVRYGLFLEEADPDLYSWIMGYAPVKPEFTEFVNAIRLFVDSQIGNGDHVS